MDPGVILEQILLPQGEGQQGETVHGGKRHRLHLYLALLCALWTEKGREAWHGSHLSQAVWA
ncbi:hypothetical protein E2C01_099324 [Portunus trituberculatus]|uniref:Uncharacterized protein n=1 Tax=Portunus trituberculatus TaxID=210409 RepID=A0A5B7KAP4_PORTR|nr:hypothetical protein [Portunus trituberculatus]